MKSDNPRYAIASHPQLACAGSSYLSSLVLPGKRPPGLWAAGARGGQHGPAPAGRRSRCIHGFPGTRRLLTLLCLLILIALLGGCDSGATVSPAPSATLAPPQETTIPPTPTARPTEEYSEVRPAAVADAFYPADPAQIETLLARYLDPVQRLDGTPIGLIVPHAGWVYSGAVAAVAYKQLEGVAPKYEAIVIIGPNHQDPDFDAVSVYAQGAFETPLGQVAVDEPLATALIEADERIVFDRDVHRQEHSIEVQLPFLQRLCPDCAIVPVIIGQPTPENLNALTQALIETLRDRRALIIASSDLSHYPRYEDAIAVDTSTLVAIESMDPELVSSVLHEQMQKGIPGLVTCACGEGPILVTLRVAQALGADHAQILRYANSGDVGGDASEVVGYGAVMFWRWEPPDLSAAEQAELLALARHTLARYLETQTLPAPDPPDNPTLQRRLGAFVTLKQTGELRGCIGHMYGDTPLYQTVAQVTVDTATKDPRFPPLPADKLDEVEIEISVLSPFKRVRDVHDPAEIEVGRHGLYLLYGRQRGVLLPQVPLEQGWDRAEYLEQICAKAGRPSDCWEQATLYTFTAQVFSKAGTR